MILQTANKGLRVIYFGLRLPGKSWLVITVWSQKKNWGVNNLHSLLTLERLPRDSHKSLKECPHLPEEKAHLYAQFSSLKINTTASISHVKISIFLRCPDYSSTVDINTFLSVGIEMPVKLVGGYVCYFLCLLPETSRFSFEWFSELQKLPETASAKSSNAIGPVFWNRENIEEVRELFT